MGKCLSCFTLDKGKHNAGDANGTSNPTAPGIIE